MSLTAGVRRRPPSKDRIMQWVKEAWVAEAWVAVPADVIMKSLKKCGITNAMDGTEDEQLFNSDFENDLSNPFSDVPVPESPACSNDDPVQLNSDEETDSATAEEDPDSMDEYETGDILTSLLNVFQL